MSVRDGWLIGMLAAVVAGCAAESGRDVADPTGGAPAAVRQPVATHAPSQPASGGTATGTVEETMSAGGYTYVRVNTGTEELWAAASEFDVSVGERVVIDLEMPMENFHSRSLDRDFDRIYFVSRIAKEGETGAPAAGQALPPGHPPTAGDVTDEAKASPAEPIPPPAGGKTVSQIWDERQTLAGQRVTVRGKVVKFNGGIMGRNWLHIQDGTGKPADGSNDLTLTTDAVAAVGDIVTASGIVAVDQDFGSGYAYAVLLEQARLEPAP